MTVQYLNPPELLQSPAVSQAVIVEHPSRTVYVGGQNGVDTSGALVGDDLATQTARAIDNARVALAAARQNGEMMTRLGQRLQSSQRGDRNQARQLFADLWTEIGPDR